MVKESELILIIILFEMEKVFIIRSHVLYNIDSQNYSTTQTEEFRNSLLLCC